MKRSLLAFFAALSVCSAHAWPFLPSSADTTNLAVTASAQNATVPGVATGAGLKQLVVSVDGTQTVFFRCDGTTATVSNAQPAFPKAPFVLSLALNVSACSVIAASTGSTIYLTLGSGD